VLTKYLFICQILSIFNLIFLFKKKAMLKSNELMWIAIHKCMEAMPGISLYRYLYPKLAKTLYLSYYLLCFLYSKTGEEEGGTGSAWKWRVGGGREKDGGELAQAMYTHVSKCKNNKIKGERKKDGSNNK
jgi:hypothetical protein